jgi:hypothetical protein
MVFSTTKSTTPRRRLARIAVAGAFVAVPLTALAVPAMADPSADGPAITQVRHDSRDDRGDCDRPGFQDDWNHSPGRRDDCDRDRRDDRGRSDDRGRGDDPWRFPRHLLPHGLFGSS